MVVSKSSRPVVTSVACDWLSVSINSTRELAAPACRSSPVIPRAILVADVIEAMSSHRPYRPSLGINKAFAEIMRNSGTLYDTDVVNATVKLFSRKALDAH